MFGGYYLKEKLGNNVFCFDKNKPLWITKMIEGNILDAKKGKKRVFRERKTDLSKCESFVGLENCILQKRTIGTGKSQFVFLVDNHNWALWCWKFAIEKGIIKKGAKLLHIDQHSDMNDNYELPITNYGDVGQKYFFADDFEKLVVEGTTIASFIKPALELGILSEVELVLSEYKLFNYELPITNYDGILDIDLDFWDKRAGYKDLDKHKKIMQNLILRYSVITIATSPCFIDQDYALELLEWLFGEDV